MVRYCPGGKRAFDDEQRLRSHAVFERVLAVRAQRQQARHQRLIGGQAGGSSGISDTERTWPVVDAQATWYDRLGGRSLVGPLQHFAAWVPGLGLWGPVVFILGYALATVAFAPGSVLTLAAGALFGLVYGTAYALVGSGFEPRARLQIRASAYFVA